MLHVGHHARDAVWIAGTEEAQLLSDSPCFAALAWPEPARAIHSLTTTMRGPVALS